MTKVTHLTLDEGGGLSRKRIHLREISGDADSPLETVGQDLRAGRLRRGDDLATVSKALKIRKDHLEALEEDRFESLPGRTYAIGFVRSYAEYLGLDPVESVERFKSEIAGRDDAPKQAAFHTEGEERRLPHGWVIIAVVVVLLVFYGAYRLARTADTLLSESVAPVPSRIAPPVRKGPPQPKVVQAPLQHVAPATVPDQSTTAVSPPPPASAAGAQTGTQAQTGDQQTSPDGISPPPAEGHVYGQQNTGARVVLRAIRATRILVEGNDGTIYINRLLQQGDTYRVPDDVGLTLSTPDANALQVELDGQMMGVVGAPRHIAEGVSLDPQAIVDRYNSSGPAQ
jgi:cytoskeleton protein RodZ